MTAKQLFSKTTPFIWAKLLLGGALVLISSILLVILMLIGWLFESALILVIMAIIWVTAVKGIHFFLMQYVGYLIKAGHIAVIAEACFTGTVPDNQVAYGKDMVIKRFATANVYLAVDKLVTAAVREIQKGIGKVGNALDFIPGMEAAASAAQFFVSIALGYVDECCLGWTFYNKEQGAFKSAADGVVIYAQNWKVLLKDAAKTMLKVVLLTIVVALIIFIPIGLLFKLLNWPGLLAFLLACLVAWVVKFAVMDSYIMIQMMASYMGVAPTTTITFDLYSKLCSLSKKFKELFTRGQEESPQPGYASGTAGAGYIAQETAPTGNHQPQQAVAKEARPVFCGQCGTKNTAGTKFCGTCGTRL
ncbi:MAG: zinc ribbon domain-containing protein [Lachnospiraceae bacterium]|nr:zinc ribbon domain-containing protein [Lachnospiraceae bacterium]